MDDHYFIMVDVYGFNNVIQNRQFISDVFSVIVNLKIIYPTAIIIMGGDFNMVMDECLDRYPSRCTTIVLLITLFKLIFVVLTIYWILGTLNILTI